MTRDRRATGGETARAALLLALLAACAPEAPPPRGEVDGRTAVVRSELPLSEVRVLDAAGLVLARRDLPPETLEASLPLGAVEPGEVVIRAVRADGSFDLPAAVPPPPARAVVRVDVPLGQGAREVRDGERLGFTAVRGASVTAGLLVEAARPGPVEIRAGEERRSIRLGSAGERRVVPLPVPLDRDTEVRVEGPGGALRFVLAPAPLSPEEARRRLRATDLSLPTDRAGERDPARPRDRVRLPTRWWSRTLRSLGLGLRPTDREAPWGHQAVTLANAGPAPLNVVVRSRVLDADGRPAAAFRPRIREYDATSGEISALLRVPAGGEARAVLPFFVNEALLPDRATEWTWEVQVTPLGSAEPLLREARPLRSTRGSTAASAGFLATLVLAAGGILWAFVGLPRRLRGFSTPELTTIGVFATLSFVVSAATAVVAVAAATLLGPFSGFATGLLDDVLRTVLMATLVTLLPRPGTLTLSEGIAWLLRGLALGSWGPTDALFMGARVALLEGCAWLAGLTRGSGAVDEAAGRRALRLAAAFGAASVGGAAVGFVLSVVLYRLYFAGWYVGAFLLGPGFLYVAVGCGVAARFAASLREVEA